VAQADIVALTTVADGADGWGPAMRGAMSTIAAADLANLVSNFPTVVVHGSDDSVARPAGAVLVIWVGTVEPVNGATGDLYIDTTP
jgi:hypothetical protein